MANHRRMDHPRRSVQAVPGRPVPRCAGSNRLQLGRRRHLRSSRVTGCLRRERASALRFVCRQASRRLSRRPDSRAEEDSTGSDARHGVRLAHVDVGAPPGEDRQLQSVSLLLRRASRIPRRLTTSRVRLGTRLGAAVRIPPAQGTQPAPGHAEG